MPHQAVDRTRRIHAVEKRWSYVQRLNQERIVLAMHRLCIVLLEDGDCSEEDIVVVIGDLEPQPILFEVVTTVSEVRTTHRAVQEALQLFLRLALGGSGAVGDAMLRRWAALDRDMFCYDGIARGGLFI